MPHSTQVYKWVPVNLFSWGGGEPCDGVASHPGCGENRNTLSFFMIQKLKISSDLTLDNLAYMQTLHFAFTSSCKCSDTLILYTVAKKDAKAMHCAIENLLEGLWY